MAEGTQYRFFDLIWAKLKARRLDAEEEKAVISRAGLIDDTWTISEQLAHERYRARQTQTNPTNLDRILGSTTFFFYNLFRPIPESEIRYQLGGQPNPNPPKTREYFIQRLASKKLKTKEDPAAGYTGVNGLDREGS